MNTSTVVKSFHHFHFDVPLTFAVPHKTPYSSNNKSSNNSKEHRPTWEADNRSSGQKISYSFSGNRRFITVFTRVSK
jgi:hypothetical protein